MGRLEVACRRLAVLSGMRQEADDYAVCVHPRAAGLHRKGTLTLLSEPAGRHPSLGVEACRLVQSIVIRHYYGDHSLSLTSSLINALQGANSALLRYNYGSDDGAETSPGGAGSVAVRAGGVQTRSARVGLAAVLMRPDGEGFYLAQTAPTQVYIRHNGLLTALPEPPGWQETRGEHVVPLRRSTESTEEAEPGGEETPALSVVAPPLGSGPQIEVDLVYRRASKGDLIVMVSSSLARHLDRDTAESIFSSGDADTIIGSLYSMATELGLAEAHACALQVGVEVSSGVETDYSEIVAPPDADQVATNGGVRSVPPGSHPALPNFKGALKGSKEWLSRKRQPLPREAESLPSSHAPSEDYEEMDQTPVPSSASYAPSSTHNAPTEIALSHSLHVPPFLSENRPGEHNMGEELDFDGWEDAPPALGNPLFRLEADPVDASEDTESEPVAPEFVRTVIRPRLIANGSGNGSDGKGYGAMHAEGSNGATVRANGSHHHVPSPRPVPALFDPNDDLEGLPQAISTPMPAPTHKKSGHLALRSRIQNPKFKIQNLRSREINWSLLGRKALRQTGATLRSLLPERAATPSESAADSKKAVPSTRLPMRVVIALGLALVTGILLLSVLNMMGGQKQNVVVAHLEEAKRLDLLASQPAASPADKHKNLELALQKAQQALAADPTSVEAKRLVAKIEGTLDKANGITRLANVKLLFDLDVVGKNPDTTPEAKTATEGMPQAPISTTARTNDILVQSNDAYILDREKSKIYRCRISTKGCLAILSGGDTVGGQTVGSLVAMALRVGSLVALDSKLTTYVYDADKSGWQAQPLGDAAKLEQPKDVATYDGNLYLLGSRPSQISKYTAGQYEAPPADWIKGQPGMDQVKNAAAMAIDGSIYVLSQDGRIVVLQGGAVARTIALKPGTPGAPTDIYTSTDTRDLYVVSAPEGTIVRMSKEGQAVATFKLPSSLDGSLGLGGTMVDEGKGKIYFMLGRQAYEAILPAQSQQAGDQAPGPRPIAEP